MYCMVLWATLQYPVWIKWNILQYRIIPCDTRQYHAILRTIYFNFIFSIFWFLFDCGVVRNGGGKDGGGVVTVRHGLHNDDDDGDDDDG